MGPFRQRIHDLIHGGSTLTTALTAINSLTAAQHAQLATAVNGLTPQDTAALASAAATGGTHPIIDLLSGFITDPTQLAAVIKFIMTIIALIPK